MTEISVLLVDDQDLFREGVRVIVDAQEGMTVVGAAADGLEAVQLVDELERMGTRVDTACDAPGAPPAR